MRSKELRDTPAADQIIDKKDVGYVNDVFARIQKRTAEVQAALNTPNEKSTPLTTEALIKALEGVKESNGIGGPGHYSYNPHKTLIDELKKLG